MSGLWVTVVGLNKIKDRSKRDKMGWCYKVNAVSLTAEIAGTSGSCLSPWGKREKEKQTNSNKEK